MKLPSLAVRVSWRRRSGVRSDQQCRRQLRGNYERDESAFVYGAGADYAFARHITLRAEYRGYVYKAPDFNLASLNTGSWTNIAQPSAGIAFHF